MANDRPKWFFIDTPNPNKFGISIPVPMSSAVAFGKDSGDRWPQEGDALKNNVLVAAAGIRIPELFGNFQYVTFKIGTTSEREPAVYFNYGPDQTEEQKQEPFREVTSKRNHPWPPMLLALALIPDYTFLRTGKGYNSDENEISEVVAPTYYVREVYVPGVNEGTKMVKREFFSATKYDIPHTPVPIATSVSYDINGVRGTFPESLHPDILIQSTRSGIAQVVAGVVSEVGGALEGQLFPATNFKEWAPYIVTDTQEQVEAGWYRTQWLAIPPEKPKTIVQ